MKVRWGLTVDEAQKAKMTEMAASCPATTVTVV